MRLVPRLWRKGVIKEAIYHIPTTSSKNFIAFATVTFGKELENSRGEPCLVARSGAHIGTPLQS